MFYMILKLSHFQAAPAQVLHFGVIPGMRQSIILLASEIFQIQLTNKIRSNKAHPVQVLFFVAEDKFCASIPGGKQFTQ